MLQNVRIRLSSNNLQDLEDVIQKIKNIAEKTGIKMKGPIPLPTRQLTIPTRKSPCGEGTQTWEKYYMRIHKRIIDVTADERSMMLIMKISFPDSVLPEIQMI